MITYCGDKLCICSVCDEVFKNAKSLSNHTRVGCKYAKLKGIVDINQREVIRKQIFKELKRKDIMRWRNNDRDHYNTLMRKYRAQNPNIYIARDKRKRSKLLSKTWELKSKPCTDCGVQYPPYVMQFDHVRGKKVDCVSRITSYKKIEEEAAKCDVVCANCHAVRTWERRFLNG